MVGVGKELDDESEEVHDLESTILFYAKESKGLDAVCGGGLRGVEPQRLEQIRSRQTMIAVCFSQL